MTIRTTTVSCGQPLHPLHSHMFHYIVTPMAKFELKQIKGDTWYIPSPSNIGVFIDQGTAMLIDSGNDKDAGRKIRQVLEADGLRVTHIINTHANADHIGGNAYLQQHYQCRIMTPEKERAFVEFPDLEPMLLWGADPLPATRNKFLVAQPSRVTDTFIPGGRITSTNLESVALPGHFLQMTGVLTPDDVLFTADALFPIPIIERYHIFYIHDVSAFLQTLDHLESLQDTITWFVPGHGEPSEDIRLVIAANREKVLSIRSAIREICRHGVGFDHLFKRVTDQFSLRIDPTQYVLIASTLRSYISHMVRLSMLEMDLSEGVPEYRTIQED